MKIDTYRHHPGEQLEVIVLVLLLWRTLILLIFVALTVLLLAFLAAAFLFVIVLAAIVIAVIVHVVLRLVALLLWRSLWHLYSQRSFLCSSLQLSFWCRSL